MERKSNKGVKLHKHIATGQPLSSFQGMEGKIESAKSDVAQVGAELKEKKAK